MQIYVIKPGDNLWRISNLYNISPERLIEANRIPNPNNLVVGQTIVIPIQGMYHFVQPGESLFSISSMYGISPQELARINGIADPNLIRPGLRLYIPQGERPDIYTAAYIDLALSKERAQEIVSEVGPFLTYLNVFSYPIRRDGTLQPVDDQAALQAAKNNRVLPIMVVTNFEEGTFKTEIATAIFTDEALQDKLLNEILSVMQEKGYAGVDFDLECLGRENRERYVAFLQKAVDKFRPLGYEVSVALAPKLSEDQQGVLYEGHDYRAIGEVVDYVNIMTYEWGWSGGPPMPVAPINEVSRVMDFAVSQIPSDKIMMGIPLYGYDWRLPYERGGQWARALSPQRAVALAAQVGAAILFDEKSQSPYFHYYDSSGNRHEVWFEDARSVQAKFDLVKEYGLRGLYYWVLGNEFPQNWLLLNDNFNIIKEERPLQ